MKKIKLITASFLASAMMLAGCGGNNNPDDPDDHQHTFSEKWTTDDTYHWHKATCGHDVVSDKGEHVDEDGDHYCDVCEKQVSELDPVPAVTKVTVTLTSNTIYEGETTVAKANVSSENGAPKTVTWSSSNEAVATVDAEGNVQAIKAGTVKIIATSVFDSTKKGEATLTVKVDQGFDPTWIEEGFTYSKEFPVDIVKGFLGEGEYKIVVPSEMLEGGAYYLEAEADAQGPACVVIIIDGALDESYAYDLFDEGFDRVYSTSYGYEAVDPTGKYTVSMYCDFDEETYEAAAPTYIEFYKSADVWASSEFTSDVAWDDAKIVNEDSDEIAVAKEWVSKVPFVALGEDYEIEYVAEDSRDEYIELLEMFGIIDETTSEEEIEFYLELLGYTGPEYYLQISDYSVCKPFEGYDDVLLNAGFAYIEYEDEYGDVYDYYEKADGLISYIVSFGFTESGNTIYLEEGIATLEAFPVDEANAFIKDVLGSENSIVAYEETEGASFQAVVGDEEMDILVDYVDLTEAQAYADKLEGLGFEVEYIPADDFNYPSWFAKKGKLVVEFYLEQFLDEDTESYLDEGPLYFFIYADPNKHEEQGIYLPEEINTNVKVGLVTLDPELVKLGDSVNLTWTSSDEGVATVDADGVVTLLAAGEVNITVTTDVAIPDVGGFFSATTKLVVAEKPDFAPVLADLNDALAYYGGTEVLSADELPEIDCAEYEFEDYFLYYGCYVIWGDATNETEASYAEKVEALGFEILEDEYGKYYETEEYQIYFSLFEDEDEGDYFQIEVYFKQVAAEGATFDFSELSGTSGSMNGFSFTTSKAGGQSDPAYNDNKSELRLYANNTITFTSEEPMTEIFFDANTCGESKATATFVSASTGSVSEVDGGFLWEGNATEVTLTVSGSGQIHINLIDINGGGSGGGGGGGQSEGDLASWPASQIAACLEGGTELVPPAAEGTSFTFEESDEYYYDCYVGVYGGDADAYLDTLEKAGFDVTDEYLEDYGCMTAVSADGTLTIDLYEEDGYYVLDIYASEPSETYSSWADMDVESYFPGFSGTIPAATGSSFELAGEEGYIQIYIEGGDVDAYVSALSKAGYDIDDEYGEWGMYFALSSDGSLEIDAMDYGDGTVFIQMYWAEE